MVRSGGSEDRPPGAACSDLLGSAPGIGRDGPASGTASPPRPARMLWRRRRMPPGGTSLPPRRFPYATRGRGDAARWRTGKREHRGSARQRRRLPSGRRRWRWHRHHRAGALALFFGVDPSVILSGGGERPRKPGHGAGRAARPVPGRHAALRRAGAGDDGRHLDGHLPPRRQYLREPNLVLFTGGTQSACGSRRPRPGRSTARATTRCISTSASSRTWSAS